MKRIDRTIISLAALLFGVPSVASAYSTPEAFSDDPRNGGGGGRFFTGSFRDGFTCDVCHQGAAAPDVWVSGLPQDGVVWGETYEVSIGVDGVLAGGVSVVAEIADGDGRRVGTVARPDATELNDFEKCKSGLPAASEYDDDGRTVVALTRCGAQRLRFFWTAPSEPTPGISFYVAAVDSDDSMDPQGDGVFAAQHVLQPRGGGTASQGCALGDPNRAGAWWLLFGIPALYFARTRRC